VADNTRIGGLDLVAAAASPAARSVLSDWFRDRGRDFLADWVVTPDAEKKFGELSKLPDDCDAAGWLDWWEHLNTACRFSPQWLLLPRREPPPPPILHVGEGTPFLGFALAIGLDLLRHPPATEEFLRTILAWQRRVYVMSAGARRITIHGMIAATPETWRVLISAGELWRYFLTPEDAIAPGVPGEPGHEIEDALMQAHGFPGRVYGVRCRLLGDTNPAGPRADGLLFVHLRLPRA
jgi:hypothetical protein